MSNSGTNMLGKCCIIHSFIHLFIVSLLIQIMYFRGSTPFLNGTWCIHRSFVFGDRGNHCTLQEERIIRRLLNIHWENIWKMLHKTFIHSLGDSKMEGMAQVSLTLIKLADCTGFWVVGQDRL